MIQLRGNRKEGDNSSSQILNRWETMESRASWWIDLHDGQGAVTHRIRKHRVDGSDATGLEGLVMGYEDFVSHGFSFSRTEEVIPEWERIRPSRSIEGLRWEENMYIFGRVRKWTYYGNIEGCWMVMSSWAWWSLIYIKKTTNFLKIIS